MLRSEHVSVRIPLTQHVSIAQSTQTGKSIGRFTIHQFDKFDDPWYSTVVKFISLKKW